MITFSRTFLLDAIVIAGQKLLKSDEWIEILETKLDFGKLTITSDEG